MERGLGRGEGTGVILDWADGAEGLNSNLVWKEEVLSEGVWAGEDGAGKIREGRAESWGGNWQRGDAKIKNTVKERRFLRGSRTVCSKLCKGRAYQENTKRADRRSNALRRMCGSSAQQHMCRSRDKCDRAVLGWRVLWLVCRGSWRTRLRMLLQMHPLGRNETEALRIPVMLFH